MRIDAYVIPDAVPLPLTVAPRSREWMKEIKGITLCLPLMVASQWGWWLRNPIGFTAHWSGSEHREGLTVAYDTHPGQVYAASHFGGGILTVYVPYVFRTPRGWNVWLRGPTNYSKTGITPLEGIVEGDWNNATATMNWRMERGATVRFEKDDPLCHILPIPRNIEEFDAEIREMPEDMAAEYIAWRDNRQATIQEIEQTMKPKYELTYKARAENKKLNVSPWSSGF